MYSKKTDGVPSEVDTTGEEPVLLLVAVKVVIILVELAVPTGEAVPADIVSRSRGKRT